MYFTEFLMIIILSIAITWGLVVLFEKLIYKGMKRSFHLVVLLIIALIPTYLILGIITYTYLSIFYMDCFLAAGLVVILNRYWLGHFSVLRKESSY